MWMLPETAMTKTKITKRATDVVDVSVCIDRVVVSEVMTDCVLSHGMRDTESDDHRQTKTNNRITDALQESWEVTSLLKQMMLFLLWRRRWCRCCLSWLQYSLTESCISSSTSLQSASTLTTHKCFIHNLLLDKEWVTHCESLVSGISWMPA